MATVAQSDMALGQDFSVPTPGNAATHCFPRCPSPASQARRPSPHYPINEPQGCRAKLTSGGMGEWLKPAVLKTVSPERGSGVRIPLPPPRT